MLARQRTGLSVQVQEHVKQLLLDGHLQLGSAIQVDVIAADLGVSRQPVMDAIRRLAQEGFVEIVPQVGSFPRRYETQEMLDFFRLFAESECVVARLACARADEQGLDRLRSISSQIGKLARLKLEEAELARQYRSLNRRFHSQMRAMAKSFVVAEIVETMGDRSDFLVAGAQAPIFMKRLKVAHSEHEGMIKAIAARDVDGATSIMRQHVMAIAERIAKANAGIATTKGQHRSARPGYSLPGGADA